MKFSTLSLSFLLLALVSCKDNSVPKGELYQCICEEEPVIEDETKMSIKERYVYLVYSEGEPDCCTASVADAYTGYKEAWKNLAPDNPRVWQRIAIRFEKIAAADAQSLGCQLEPKKVSFNVMKYKPFAAAEYYPEFYADKK